MVSQFSTYTHAGFHWSIDQVFDSNSGEGVKIKPNTPYKAFEILVSLYYPDSNVGVQATEHTETLYTGRPYINLFAPWEFCDKWTTDRFYCSQLVWRGYYDQGVDLDSNTRQVGMCVLDPYAPVFPDDIYGSYELGLNWDSTYEMTCTDPNYPWKGDYYDNPTLTGSSLLTYCDEAIDFNWGQGSPSGSLPIDNFSVYWTRMVSLPPGFYRFHLAGDDGFELYVDGDRIINEWHDQSRTEYTADRYLNGGNHEIEIFYYEHVYDASISFWWEPINKNFLPLILNDGTYYGFGPTTPTPPSKSRPTVTPTSPAKLVPTPTRPPYP